MNKLPKKMLEDILKNLRNVEKEMKKKLSKVQTLIRKVKDHEAKGT
jgi:uncharacterized radical SAM superfamily Fe-S cluster-containing enzyme